jgi:surface carbohydrate biosynthesis protein
MALKIQIHIADPQRDTATMVLLGKFLEDYGYRVFYSRNEIDIKLYEIVQPEIFILAHSFHLPVHFLAEASKKTMFFHLPTEGAILDDRTAILNFAGFPDYEAGEKNNKYTKYFRMLFSWGDYYKDLLSEEKIYKPEDISVVGNPRFDLHCLKAEPETSHDSLGIVGAFDLVNNFRSLLEGALLMQLDKDAGTSLYVEEDKEVEDRYWFHFHNLRILYQIIGKVYSRTKIYLRPHPREIAETYQPIIENYFPEMKLSYSEENFNEFLDKSYAMLVSSSTSIIEGLIRELPIISTLALDDQKVSQHITLPDVVLPYVRFCHLPKTVDEAVDLILQAKSGTLKPLTFDDDGKKYLSEVCSGYYGFPLKKLSTRCIADIIHDIAAAEIKKENTSTSKDAQEDIEIYRKVYSQLISKSLIKRSKLIYKLYKSKMATGSKIFLFFFHDEFKYFQYIEKIYPQLKQLGSNINSDRLDKIT